MPTKINNKEAFLTKLINISVWTSECSYSIMRKAEQCVCGLSFFFLLSFRRIRLGAGNDVKNLCRAQLYWDTDSQYQERK